FQEIMLVVTNTRNICIIAHIDHGKTSLCDHLIAYSGLIPKRVAGQMKYLDYRTDEQQRLITIQNSAIFFEYTPENGDNTYKINLIDSPGHIDFGIEVSIATNVSDGAILLVDVVERLQPQTRTVLSEAIKAGLKVILVLTKIDRLFNELNLEPEAIYDHINQCVDEAGRGPLAGPLYVSAFSFFEHKKEILKWIENLDNSKIISEKHREKLYKQIVLQSESYKSLITIEA
uniref:Elongation factor-like GTPase 1 n=1 Tax=Dermatophagoides pteronyssinus TaxID=6956 RepID=A0A6P6YA54_DERPT